MSSGKCVKFDERLNSHIDFRDVSFCLGCGRRQWSRRFIFDCCVLHIDQIEFVFHFAWIVRFFFEFHNLKVNKLLSTKIKQQLCRSQKHSPKLYSIDDAFSRTLCVSQFWRWDDRWHAAEAIVDETWPANVATFSRIGAL